MPLYDGHHTPARTAEEAARRLAALGHHVHLHASNESRCISGHCKEN
ncbi:hypothetical protein [Streptomyces sp. SID161]|nr:hypothetical protein [Streptomyces sp. SID161]MYW48852.1 hypothetical protein [Streptomyces sp. SID161]MYW49863.1 hypothetical protein [Streptomyces sp. SID161]